MANIKEIRKLKKDFKKLLDKFLPSAKGNDILGPRPAVNNSTYRMILKMYKELKRHEQKE